MEKEEEVIKSEDEIYVEALAFSVERGETSVSFIRRYLPIGYTLGQKIITWMEQEGYIALFSGERTRKVFATQKDVEALKEKLARGEPIAPKEEPVQKKSILETQSSYTLPKSIEENPLLVSKVYLWALQMVVDSNSASLSMLQEKLDISYNKAWQILGWMAECGYITPFDGENLRKVLITKEHFERIYGDFV